MLKIFIKPLKINVVVNSFIGQGRRSLSCYSSQKILLKIPIQSNNVFIQRNISRYLFWFLYPSDLTLRKRDKVLPSYKMIYKGDTAKYVKYGYSFYIGVSGSGIVIWIGQFLFFNEMFMDALSQGNLYIYVVILSFYFSLLYGMHDLAKDYIYRIYYSETDDKFLAVLMDKHPFAEKKLELIQKSLVPHKTSKLVGDLFPWKKYLYEMPDKKKIYFSPENFEHMGYYNKLIKEYNTNFAE